jgi:regulator of sigma E protease
MNILWTTLSFLVAILLLVFIHEYGHFKVARLCGIHVKRFSIGFGKPFLTKVDRHGTEWTLAPLPLGGYVSMVDSRVEALAPGEEAVAFDKKSLWKRSAVVLAGPLANLLFAWVAWTILLTGPSQDFGPYLGSPLPGSVAEKAGFDPRDAIFSVDGTPTRTLPDVQLAIIHAAMSGKDATLVASRDGQTRNLTLELTSIDAAKLGSADGLRAIGFPNPMGARLPAMVNLLVPGSPAEKAGLRVGDIVVGADGSALPSWSAFVALVGSKEGKELVLSVQSPDGSLREIKVTPAVPQGSTDKVAKIGASIEPSKIPKELKESAYVKVERGLGSSMAESFRRCTEMTKLTLGAIGSMISGRSGADNVAGPIGIAKQAGSAATSGPESYLSFLAFLSLSLFIMNMLPLPSLDGGHLVVFAIEGFLGRPLSEATQTRIAHVGFSLLGGLMLLALYNDMARTCR